MHYVKQNFTDGAVLKAEHLNHIEDAIEELYENAVTVEDVIAAFPNGDEVAY